MASLPGKEVLAITLWICLSADFGVSLPSDFSSLLGPRIVIDFLFVRLLFVIGLES